MSRKTDLRIGWATRGMLHRASVQALPGSVLLKSACGIHENMDHIEPAALPPATARRIAAMLVRAADMAEAA